MPVIHFAQRLNNKLLCFLTMLLELMTFGVTVVSDPLGGGHLPGFPGKDNGWSQ